MVVYFLRHASAGQKRSSAKQDEKRPLDKEGVVQSRHIGRLLAAMNVELDAIVSSPLKRATQTAALVANEVGYEGKLELAVAMRPDSRFDSFRIMLEKYQRKEAVMVVGHNPSISEFASLVLTGGDDGDVLDLKKAAVARVEMKGTRSGVLTWCVTPRIARALYEVASASSTPKTSRK